MNCLRHSDTFVLLLLTCLLNIKLTSTQEGSSYFFYQQPEYPRDCKDARDRCSSDNFSGVYTIKPDGYPQPFEVYCNNDIETGGWTVIQRHVDGSLTFKRIWDDYKNGFGFLSAEFWIGNDKLSHLTNQAVYELRIDMILSNGSSFYIKYKSFRISDEFSNYAIVSAEDFSGNSSCVVSTCPPEMKHGGCSCQPSCNDPIQMTDCHDNCVETCVPSGCFVSGNNVFIPNGESYINIACTENCTCIDNNLNCNSNYECSTDATCQEENNVHKCYCNDGYDGDGETCTALYTDCYDAYQDNQRQDGVYTILPTGWPGSPFNVSCDMTTAGGGWTIFQRRTDGVTNFYRYWEDFKNGFGSVEQGNDFWLGNEQIYYLTNQKAYKLRVDIRTSGNVPKYAEYSSFSINNETFKYQLSIGGYSGDAGDGFSGHNGKLFSTRDEDNDGCVTYDFAEGHKGGWWYSDDWCANCYSSYCPYIETGSSCKALGTLSNLNSDYNGGNGENIWWYYNNNCNLKYTEMKLRPSSV